VPVVPKIEPGFIRS